jgi:hypothetical protein
MAVFKFVPVRGVTSAVLVDLVFGVLAVVAVGIDFFETAIGVSSISKFDCATPCTKAFQVPNFSTGPGLYLSALFAVRYRNPCRLGVLSKLAFKVKNKPQMG